MNPAYFRVALFAAVATVCCAEEADTGKTLTARQLFYSPRTQRQGAAQTARPSKPRPKPDAPGTAQAVVKPRVPETPGAPPSETQPRNSCLGLRYLVRQVVNGEMRDVDPDKTFTSGDRIKLGIESNETSYLYVVHEGSDGKWDVLYPGRGGQHKVQPRLMIDIPGGTEDFTFDDKPGTERLLVVLSRSPETDLERLVNSLRHPGRKDPPSSRPPVMMASVPDMEKFRATLTSRNLRVEKRPQVSGKREEAVYIVNASTGDSGQRVVAEIALKHR